MAINTGKFRIRGVDMDEIVPFGVDLFKRFATPLCEDEMTRFAVAGFNRHLAVGCQVFAVVASKAPIPIEPASQ
jgi:hypothetical protein